MEKKVRVCQNSNIQGDYKAAPNGSYDERYIEAYIANPKAGKAAALREAGYVGDYAPQEARRIHTRLRDEIEERINENISDGAAVGFDILLELAKNASSESVKAQCAKNLMDYAGRKPGDTLTIKKDYTDEELDQEIANLQKEIAQSEGRKLDS